MKYSYIIFILVLTDINISLGQRPSGDKEKITYLDSVTVIEKKLQEEKFGIKNKFSLVHFIDASTDQKDIFEIAQRIKFDTVPSKITSVNLLINKDRSDSGLFKISFYKIADNKPSSKLAKNEIIEKKAIKKGWLKFDLNKYNIRLKGDFVVGIEFLSPIKDKEEPISYEIKLGGFSKSFVRNGPDEEWRTPPHHFKLYVTALIDSKNHIHNFPDEDLESVPTIDLFSKLVNDSFSIFIHTPPGYTGNGSKRYSVIYLLDGNVYFDILAQQKRKIKGKIIVGIGYKNAYLMDSLRNRDYTFPIAEKQDSFAISGGGEKFLDFVTKELIPCVDKNYQTNEDRALMGHSLGGYFTLFAFQKLSSEKKTYFNKFTAASPTLYYGNEYLRKELEHHQPLIDKKIRVTITYGENEFKEDSTLSNYFNHYSKDLKQLENLKLKTKVYPKYGHMDTAVPTFKNAL